MRRALVGLLLISLLWARIDRVLPARAQSMDAQAIIDAVNELRSSYGLAPYTVDPWLMEYAQQHSDYQAAIGISTHTHSDGSVSLDLGILENVAGGTVGWITTSFVVYQVWADPVHMKPMVGYTAGSVGVGVAVGGDLVYITFNMRPAGDAVLTDSVDSQETRPTSIPNEALVTSTPLPDGAVYHVIGYGQTLWSIALAYGVTVQQIRDFNGIPADSTDIYDGQRLLIKLPGTPYYTPTPTATDTPLASQTPISTQTFTPAPSRTPTWTPTVQNVPTQGDAEGVSQAGTDWSDLLGVVVLALAVFGMGVWVGQYRAEHRRRGTG